MAMRLLLVLVLALLLVAEVTHATRLEDLLARRHKGLRRRRRHHAHGMLAARGTQEFDVESLFAKPPAPPETKRPPFIAPHPKRDRPMNDEDRLMIQRFSSCLERSNATVNDLVIRPSIREYRDQVIKTIPGLTAWLSEGIMRELMSDKGHVVSLTLLYQNRRRNMRFPKPVEVTFSKEPPEHPNDLVRDYLASPDMNGDIAFEYFCKASSPCTMDENCLLSHLMLLSVMGEEDLNSTPDINGTDIKACQVGRYIGDAEGCNKTAPDLCKVPYTMYTVVKGDWLSRIARDHNTTVKAIVKLNPQIKNPDLIYPNQQFRIPRKGCKQSEASLCDDSFKYVVKKGDWLSKIARRYHTTVAIIHNANKDKIKDVDLIYPGQIFDIPKPGCDKPGKPKAPATKCPKHITYEVVKGDNLTKIGKMFGTTWQALHKLNPQIVDPNLIYPRQKLQVPNKECK